MIRFSSNSMSSRIAVAMILASASPAVALAQVANAPSPQAAAADTASDATGTGVGDIVVTAQKREQRLNDVGISISVVGGEQLNQLGIRDSVSVVSAVPNVENTSIYGPGTNTNFSIRGVAQNDSNDGTEAPIATYVDDIYLVTTGAGAFPLYDMQRVEVLRGPQGTLFGRNSTGGLIHYISNKPTDRFEGLVGGSYGSYNDRMFQAMLNAPIVPGVLDIRIAGQYHNNDGWLNNRTGNQPDGGQVETKALRGSVKFTPSDNITNVLRVSYDVASGHTNGIWREAIAQNATTGYIDVLPPGSTDIFGVGPIYDEADNGQLNKLIGAKSFLAINKLDWDIGNATITSVTGYNRYDRNSVQDCDGTQVPICATHYKNPSHQFSQELRAYIDAGSSRFTVGGYYLNQVQDQSIIAPLYIQQGAGSIALLGTVHQRSKGYAIFANAEFDLAPQLTLIAGLRGSRDVKSIQQVNGIYSPADPTAPWAGYESETVLPTGALIAENVFTDATANGLNRLNKNLWSGKIELDYKPSGDTLIYASVSRGVKAPGFNNGFVPIGLPFEDYRYGAETLYAYEVGLKSSFWDRKGNISVSGFYYDYHNYQALSFEGVGSFTTNNPATLYGVEADLTLKPVPRVTLQVNGGLLHSKLEDIANGGLIVHDEKMPIAPAWTVSAMARYDLPIGDNMKLGLQLDARARAKFYNNPQNDPASIVPSYGIVNGQIDIADVDDKYRLALSVKNIFNKQYVTSTFLLNAIGGYRYGYYGPPRWVSAELTVKF